MHFHAIIVSSFVGASARITCLQSFAYLRSWSSLRPLATSILIFFFRIVDIQFCRLSLGEETMARNEMFDFRCAKFALLRLLQLGVHRHSSASAFYAERLCMQSFFSLQLTQLNFLYSQRKWKNIQEKKNVFAKFERMCRKGFHNC